jgi:hypothetical protein
MGFLYKLLSLLIKPIEPKIDFNYSFGKNNYSPFTFDEISYSPSKEYCVSFMEGNSGDNLKGQIALIKNGELIYKKDIARPMKCSVSNNGYVVCCDATLVNVPCGVFYAFNENGNTIINIPVEANINDCKISNNSKYAIFTSGGSTSEDGNKLYILDLDRKEIVSKFYPPMWYDNAKINEKCKSIVLINFNKEKLKIDFKGQIIC